LEGKTSDKVPTELRYEGSACKWGFQIRPNDERFQWFKLDLDPFVPTEASELSKKYPDLKALPPGYQHQPTTLVTDFLESLRQHAERILILKLGEEIIRSTPVEYIITVPAMWSEAAQAKTRQCAEKAGMNKYASVHIISEPEAAAIYALDSMDPTSLHVGDTYVLCDAGGGTVDLISYRVTAVRPVLRVEEAAPGTGSLCGSTFLNRIFRRHMESKYGGMLGWDSETMDEAMERFETVIKRTFSGDPNEEFAIPVPGLRDNPDKGIKRGRIRMGGDELETVVFRVVTDKVIELVKAQMEATGTLAKAVLLVGGYGQSAYLRDAISKAIAPIPVTQPPYGWTAVVRGALIKGLAEIAPSLTRINVESRTARKYYGIVVSVTYRKGVHDKSRKYGTETLLLKLSNRFIQVLGSILR
jgi:molecular chaperone DnaK (HSP70)